tara:strand:- start:92 stop:601 length:510 start_codon:yes stop_codon:yes gene_type:complete
MNNLKKIIKETLEEIGFYKSIFFEDFRYTYEGSFFSNDSMVLNCKKALEAVEKNDLTKEVSNANEGSGKSKAKSILNKDPLTHSQLKRMKAFFDNNESEYLKEKSKGKTIDTSGIMQIWNLWGGDEGKRWCNNQISKRNSSNNTSKTVRGASGIRTKTLMDPHNIRIHK